MNTVNCQGFTAPQVLEKIKQLPDGSRVNLMLWGGGTFEGTKEECIARVVGQSQGEPQKKARRSMY